MELFGFQQRCQFFSEFWKVVDDYLPHYVVGDGGVVVDYTVAGGDNCATVGDNDLWKLLADMIDSFANNANIALYCTAEHHV